MRGTSLTWNQQQQGQGPLGDAQRSLGRCVVNGFSTQTHRILIVMDVMNLAMVIEADHLSGGDGEAFLVQGERSLDQILYDTPIRVTSMSCADTMSHTKPVHICIYSGGNTYDSPQCNRGLVQLKALKQKGG